MPALIFVAIRPDYLSKVPECNSISKGCSLLPSAYPELRISSLWLQPLNLCQFWYFGTVRVYSRETGASIYRFPFGALGKLGILS